MTNCKLCGIPIKFHFKSLKGYVWVPTPKNHPFYDISNHIFEHILVVEKKIGSYLKEGESVHHLDRVRDNNNPNNLVVVTEEDHAWYHKHDKKEKTK